MKVDITIPEGKSHIADNHPRSRSFRVLDGSRLDVHVPQNMDELVTAWKVLEDYTRRMAPNNESALQDLDDIGDVGRYHFGKTLGYAIFTAVDKQGNPQVMAPAEIISASRAVRRKIAQDKGVGFIYQIAHTLEVSKRDKDFSAATKLYRATANILHEISAYNGKNWLGVVTESRSSGPELEAILNAGFKPLVPNEQYRPPAVQDVKDPANAFTTDLVLLGRGVPKDRELARVAAEAYVRLAYCEHQKLGPTLDLMKQHFLYFL